MYVCMCFIKLIFDKNTLYPLVICFIYKLFIRDLKIDTPSLFNSVTHS